MKYRAIVFDLDGTLVDTNNANYLAYMKAIRLVVGRDFDIKYNPKMRFNRDSLTSLRQNLSETQIFEILKAKEKLFNDYLKETFILQPATFVLQNYSDISILVTNCSERRAKETLKHHNLLQYLRPNHCYFKEDLAQYNGDKIKCLVDKENLNFSEIAVYENDEKARSLFAEAGVQRFSEHYIRQFNIQKCTYLTQDTLAFFHWDYIKYKALGNPNWINVIKNDFNTFSSCALEFSKNKIACTLMDDIQTIRKIEPNIDTICAVPRARRNETYYKSQLEFFEIIKSVVNKLNQNGCNVEDGTYYITRYKDTKTTHLGHANIKEMSCSSIEENSVRLAPKKGITNETCNISDKVRGKNILLIEDVYTENVYIDEDMIQALLDKGAKKVILYALARTIYKEIKKTSNQELKIPYDEEYYDYDNYKELDMYDAEYYAHDDYYMEAPIQLDMYDEDGEYIEDISEEENAWNKLSYEEWSENQDY